MRWRLGKIIVTQPPAHALEIIRNLTNTRMNKYKVLAEFELDGAVQTVDSVVELSEEAAAPFVEAGQLELVAE